MPFYSIIHRRRKMCALKQTCNIYSFHLFIHTLTLMLLILAMNLPNIFGSRYSIHLSIKMTYIPCSYGEKVPASILMYGSILMDVTSMPQQFKSVPNELAITPLPTPLMTPPVTKIYFIVFGN